MFSKLDADIQDKIMSSYLRTTDVSINSVNIAKKDYDEIIPIIVESSGSFEEIPTIQHDIDFSLEFSP